MSKKPILKRDILPTKVVVGGQTVDGAHAPSNRTFRGAWQLEGEVISVDMAMARVIHRDRLRWARKPLLAELDAYWFRAAETNDEVAKSAVAAQKQRLRDVTEDPRIDGADTPGQLAELTIEALLSSL